MKKKSLLWLLLPFMALLFSCSSDEGSGSTGGLQGAWLNKDVTYQGSTSYCQLVFREGGYGSSLIMQQTTNGKVLSESFTYTYETRTRQLVITGSTLADTYKVTPTATSITLTSETRTYSFEQNKVLTKAMLQQNAWREGNKYASAWNLWQFYDTGKGRCLNVENMVGMWQDKFAYTFDDATGTLELTYDLDQEKQKFFTSAFLGDDLYFFYYDTDKGDQQVSYLCISAYTDDMPKEDLALGDGSKSTLATDIVGKWYQYNTSNGGRYYYMIDFKSDNQFRLITYDINSGSVWYDSTTYTVNVRHSQVTVSGDNDMTGTYTATIDGTSLRLSQGDNNYRFSHSEPTTLDLLKSKTWRQNTDINGTYNNYQFGDNDKGAITKYENYSKKSITEFDYEYDAEADSLKITFTFGTGQKTELLYFDTAYLYSRLLLFSTNEAGEILYTLLQ